MKRIILLFAWVFLVSGLIITTNAITITEKEATYSSYIIETEDTFNIDFDDSLTEVDLQNKILKLYGRFFVDDSNSTMPSGTKYFGFSFNATLSDGVLCYVNHNEEFGGICKDKSLFTHLPSKNTPRGLYEHVYYISWANIPTTTDKDFSIEFEFSQKPESMITYFGTGSTIVVTDTTSHLSVSVTDEGDNATYQGQLGGGSDRGIISHYFLNSTTGDAFNDDFFGESRSCFLGILDSNSVRIGTCFGQSDGNNVLTQTENNDVRFCVSAADGGAPSVQKEDCHYVGLEKDIYKTVTLETGATTWAQQNSVNVTYWDDFKCDGNAEESIPTGGSGSQNVDLGYCGFRTDLHDWAMCVVWDERGTETDDVFIDLRSGQDGNFFIGATNGATFQIRSNNETVQWFGYQLNSSESGEGLYIEQCSQFYNDTITDRMTAQTFTGNDTLYINCPPGRVNGCGNEYQEFSINTFVDQNITNLFFENSSALGNVTWSMNNTETGVHVIIHSGSATNINAGEDLIFFINAVPVDITPPAVTCTSPSNITFPNNSIWTNCSIVDIDNAIDNALVELDNLFNFTMTNSSGNWNYFNGTLLDGTHTVRIIANDTEDNVNDTVRIFFTIDTVIPQATVTLPVNITYFNNTINNTLFSNEAIGLAFAEIDGINQSMNVDGTNASLLNDTLADGTHSVLFYVLDPANNTNITSPIFFTIDTRSPNITLISPLDNSRNESGNLDTFRFIAFALNGREIKNASVYGNFSGTWALNTSNSSAITNNTQFNITTPVHNDDRSYIWNVEVYDTSGSLVSFAPENFTFFVKPSGLNMLVLDELTLAQIPLFNVTIFNSTLSLTFNNQTNNFTQSFDTIPNGAVTIEIVDVDGLYGERIFFTTINELASVDLVTYLLLLADSNFASFGTINIFGGAVSDVLLSAQRTIGGVPVVVAQEITDDTGLAAMFLDPTNTYTITASRTGFITEVISVKPNLATTTFITMTSTLELNFSTLFDDISFRFQPFQSGLLRSDGPTNFTYTVISSSSTLENFKMNITAGNGSLLFSEVVAGDADGGSIIAELNLLNLGTNITVFGHFQKTGFNFTTRSMTYQIFNITEGNYTINRVIGQVNDNLFGLSNNTTAILSLIITSIVMGATAMINKKHVSLVGMITLGLFTLLTWLNPGLFLVISLGVIAALFLRGRF